MKPALAPESQIDIVAAELAKQYNAKGDLELMFCREIASAKVTFDSLQRAVNSLDPFTQEGAAHIDRLSRTQVRYQRMQAVAIKEMKALQERRNIVERFPDQTRDCAPLADHTLFVGDKPRLKQLHWSERGRMPSPLDNTPMKVVTPDPDPAKRPPGSPNFKHVAPDLDAAAERLAASARR